MVDFFNHLGKETSLKVVFEEGNSPIQKKRWNIKLFQNFSGVILNGVSFSKYGSLSLGVIKHIKRNYDFIIVANPLTPTGILSIIYMRYKNLKYIIFSEGGFPGSGKGIKEKIKKAVLRDAFAYFSGNNLGDNYFIKYGGSEKKIFRIPFTSISSSDILRSNLNDLEKSKARKVNKLPDGFLVVCVSRFIPLKNLYWLIINWKHMPLDAHLILIGEGPEKNKYVNYITKKKISNIQILNYIEHKELLLYLQIFDLLVHPSKYDVWGLVINEAMASGLPVITTPYCLSGLELVEEGINGYICEPTEDFINKIIQLYGNAQLRQRIGVNNLHKIKDFTFETMTKRHIDLMMQLKS
jgi:glycosyltransferase involved in cell wall biosynthesis